MKTWLCYAKTISATVNADTEEEALKKFEDLYGVPAIDISIYG